MRKGILVFVLAAFTVCFAAAAGAQDADKEHEAVKKVIEAAYVKGVHIDRDTEAMRKGFHPAFVMFVYGKDGIEKMSIDEWMEKIEEGKKKSPAPPENKVTHEFSMVDVTGNAAVAGIEIYKGGKHIFTDYMSLYKFEDGWKIVGKIYHRH